MALLTYLPLLPMFLYTIFCSPMKPHRPTQSHTVHRCSGTVTPTAQTSLPSNLSIVHCTPLFLYCSKYCAYFFFPSPKYSCIFSLTNTHTTKQFCFTYTCCFVPTLFFPHKYSASFFAYNTCCIHGRIIKTTLFEFTRYKIVLPFPHKARDYLLVPFIIVSSKPYGLHSCTQGATFEFCW